MTISLLDEAIPYFKKTIEELHQFMHGHGVFCFDEVYQEYGPDAIFIIPFIMYAFDKDSPYLILGHDPEDEKKNIADKIIEMPERLHPDCLNLKSASVNKAIGLYMDLQTAPEFKRLKTKQALYERLLTLTRERSYDDNTDIKDVIADDNKLDKLLEDIRKEETGLKERYPYVYLHRDEMAKKKQDSGVSGRIETSPYIQ